MSETLYSPDQFDSMAVSDSTSGFVRMTTLVAPQEAQSGANPVETSPALSPLELPPWAQSQIGSPNFNGAASGLPVPPRSYAGNSPAFMNRPGRTGNIVPPPHDRFYFDYWHYNNAINSSSADFLVEANNRRRLSSVDSYTFGVVETFGDEELHSLVFRMPIAGTTGFETNGFGVEGCKWGNASLISKSAMSID